MDAVYAQTKTKLIQGALNIIVMLHLASYLWPKDTNVPDISYDFIIVGGGTAGCILAYRLSYNEMYKVLLIEAGGDPPLESLYPSTFSYLPNSEHDWKFKTINDGYTAQEHRGNVLELTDGKLLGGGSSLGHMLYIRGDPHDYKLWAKAANDESWDYDSLLPYFKKTECLEDKDVLHSPSGKFHGTDGPMGVTREPHRISKKYLHAFKEIGNNVILDGNGHKTLGYYEPMFMINNGIRQSMAYSFLAMLRSQPNLHVMKHTEVIQIEFDGNTAVGVKAVKNDKLLSIKARKEVILSAGAIKSPHLLLLSGVGPQDDLETYNIPVVSDLPVGKTYKDHIGVILAHKINIEDKESPLPNPHAFPIPVVIGNVALSKFQEVPDYQTVNYIIASDSDALLSMCSISYSFKDDICQSLYNQTKGKETILTKLVLLRPQSKGHVVLQSSNYSVPPLIISGAFNHDEDLEKVELYIQDFLRIAESNVFTKFGAEFVRPLLPECDSFSGSLYWRCYALSMMGTTYHYSSTCALGSVVDNRLKVFGVKQLRVVGAAVIPSAPSGHTQAPVMAMAEKAADMILEDNSN